MRRVATAILTPQFTARKDIYQFGVMCGASMVALYKLLSFRDLPYEKFVGFDSFVGLPSSEGPWKKGEFNAQQMMGLASVEETVKAVEARFHPDMRHLLIAGEWSQVLHRSVVSLKKLNPASYVDMDCDIGASCKVALKFMVENRLVVTGTLIGFHDWSGTTEWAGGESKAFKESLEENPKVTAKRIWESSTAVIYQYTVR